jgi:hypothetical protein
MSGGRWTIRWGREQGRRSGEPTSAAGRFAGRLVATLAFGLFFGLGSFFVALIAREAWRTAETLTWAERSCEIVRSEVVRSGGEEPYRPVVGFRTLDAGETVSGSQIQRRETSYGSHGGAAGRLAPYPVGATVPCYVSPEREAVLERGPLWIGLWLLLPLLFVAIGGVGLVATWRPERKDRLGRPLLKPLGDRAARTGKGRALLGFGLTFSVLGGVLFWFFGVVPFARMFDARSWDRHTCTVEHSSVVSHSSDDGTTYSVDILYRWERGRGVERSSRYSFFSGSTSGRAGKAEIVRAHPVGAEVPCWVHPERANEAVLARGLDPNAFLAAIPLAFFAVGCAMVVAGRRKAARRARTRSLAYAGTSPFLPEDPVLEVLPDFEVRPGPLPLETQSSRWGRLLGITCMAIFWNGIVGLFASEAWKDWSRGDPDWFLMLFLVPFVLAGIAFVLGILHSMLALANPRPRLVVSSSTPRLGEELEVRWAFTGRSGRLDRVHIALKGKEQATYQVGTDTRTSTEDFFEEVFVDVPAPAISMGGHATVAIPAASMHSFESGHNKILWALELEGEIRRWPNVSETYPLVVLPQPVEDHKPEDR